MRDPIFQDMRGQMKPDDEVLDRLKTALEADLTNQVAEGSFAPAPTGAPQTAALANGDVNPDSSACPDGDVNPDSSAFPDGDVNPGSSASSSTALHSPVMSAPPPSALGSGRDRRRGRFSVAHLSAAAVLVVAVIAASIFFSGRLSPEPHMSLEPTTPQTSTLTVGAGVARAPSDYQELYRLLDLHRAYSGSKALLGAEVASDVTRSEISADAAFVESPQADTGAAGAQGETGAQGEASPAPMASLAQEAGEPVVSAGEEKQATGSYSETNVQVKGIDEADIIKTDGSFLYVLAQDELTILKAAGSETKELARVRFAQNQEDTSYRFTPQEMYLSGSVLAVIGARSQFAATYEKGETDGARDIAAFGYARAIETELILYDVSDPSAPKLLNQFSQSGSYATSRLFDNTLYLVSSYYLSGEPVSDRPDSYIPLIGEGEIRACMDIEDIRIMPDIQQPTYTVVTSFDLGSCARVDEKTVLGSAETIYMSSDNLYLGSSVFTSEVKEPYADSVYMVEEHVEKRLTQLIRIGISAGALDVAAQCVVDGELLNQFSLDEYAGNLRLVVTLHNTSYRVLTDASHNVETIQYDDQQVSTNALYVLDQSMETIGSVEGLAQDERIYSARFAGSVGYMVTYRQMDPLFAFDLSDPRAPRITSELKIPGFSTYLHPFGEDRLLGLGYSATGAVREGVKLSMFNTADAFNVTELFAQSVDARESEALSNHKAVLVDVARTIIGFPGIKDFGGGEICYFVYSYTDTGGFMLRGELSLSASALSWQGIRGLFIDDYLYVFSGDWLDIFDLVTLTSVGSVRLSDAALSASKESTAIEPSLPLAVD
ncbi:MAG: beta-propeller domain-containing protein [Coriobacteriales bacterium]|jgi:uncharacterized secreted protein with C-terminal beta-propeller domain|nr:beta-propeller domain-containing protein [Coriobacteriales bacterium]